MRPKQAFCSFFLILTLFLAQNKPCEALEVKDARWGVDNRILKGHFNPVFVLFHNESEDSPFKGEVTLHRTYTGVVNGVIESQKIFLAPGAKRWVQFAPFIDSTSDHWKIQWGSGDNDWYSLPELVPGKSCRLVLHREQQDITPLRGFHPSLERLWPNQVALTDAVEAIFLDHEPNWTADQEQSFKDWLYLGGEVHILKGPDSIYPTFHGRLKFLNLEKFGRWGAGSIKKRRIQRFQLHSKNPKNSDKISLQSILNPDDGRAELNKMCVQTLIANRPRLKHNWNLIYASCLFYLLFIGPISYFIAKRRPDYRIGLGFLLLIIAIFTLYFEFVGRRGYGEISSHYKVEIARSLGDGSFDVQSWNHLFVNRSDEYSIKQNSVTAFYGNLANQSDTQGIVRSGHGGKFLTKIPLYSTRSYVARHRMKIKELLGAVIEFNPQREGREFVVKKGPGYPEGADVCLFFQGSMFSVREEGDLLIIGQPLAGMNECFLAGREHKQKRTTVHSTKSEDILPQEDSCWAIARTLMYSEFPNDIPPKKTTKNDVNIFVFTKSPSSWSLIDWPNPQLSQTLFHYTFPYGGKLINKADQQRDD